MKELKETHKNSTCPYCNSKNIVIMGTYLDHFKCMECGETGHIDYLNKKAFFIRRIKKNPVGVAIFNSIAWNSIHLNTVSRLTYFAYANLRDSMLEKTAIYEKTFTIEQQKENIRIGIMMGYISIMNLQNLKTWRFTFKI